MNLLDHEIPGFAQDVRAFLTNKTNWVAMAYLIVALYQFHAGQIDARGLIDGVSAALAGFTIRDAIHGLSQ